MYLYRTCDHKRHLLWVFVCLWWRLWHGLVWGVSFARAEYRFLRTRREESDVFWPCSARQYRKQQFSARLIRSCAILNNGVLGGLTFLCSGYFSFWTKTYGMCNTARAMMTLVPRARGLCVLWRDSRSVKLLNRAQSLIPHLLIIITALLLSINFAVN